MVMTENQQSEVTYSNPENIPMFFIYVFVLLSFDHASFQILPNWISLAPRFLISFFIIVQAFRAYRITRIPELFVVSTAIFMIFFRLPPVSSSHIALIPSDSYNDTIFEIVTNILFLSLMLPWNWLSYQLIKSRLIRILLIITTLIVYPVVLIGQFRGDLGGYLYIFSSVFFVAWFLLANIFSAPFYRSDRVKEGKNVVILTQFSLLLPLLSFLVIPSSVTGFLADLGISIWLLLTWYSAASYPYAYFLTQNQTIRAASTFYDVKMTHERVECMIFDNVDRYLRKIPEETVLATDNDKLTLMWIGLQRRV